MAKKPTSVFPTWATSVTGIANTTYPGATKQGDGWVVDEEPPADWFNWAQNSIGQWMVYTSGSAIDALQASVVDNGRVRVINGLTPSFSSPTVTIAAGTCALFNSNTPPAYEPRFWVLSIHNPITYTLPGGVLALVNTWVSIFAQRNSSTGELELTHVVGSANAFGTPSSGQLQLAVWRDGVLYDTRSIAAQGTHNMRDEDADYLTNQVFVTDDGNDIQINSRVLSRSVNQETATEYVCNHLLTAANAVTAGEGAANVFAANQLYYVYLYKPGVSGRDARILADSNCIPFLSMTAPAAGKRAKSSTGTPYQSVIMSGQAVMIGAVKRNAANTGWRHWATYGDTIYLMEGSDDVDYTVPSTTSSSTSIDLDPVSEGVPTGRYYGMQFRARFSPDATAGLGRLVMSFFAGTVTFYDMAVATFYNGVSITDVPWSPIVWSATMEFSYLTTHTTNATHEQWHRIAAVRI